MRLALTGASGIVGGFALRAARAAGHDVTCLNRQTGYQLGDAPDLSGMEALIHCAFSHAPGRYRDGEGNNPQAFIQTNLHGTCRLFDAAKRAGLRRILFLSSRAVHDGYHSSTVLTDNLPPRPANLYGEVKAKAETYLAGLGLSGTSIRATGVYGPGKSHKWRGLFADFLAGKSITPRVATEVHGNDLAVAMLLLLDQASPPATVNTSDLRLDRRDLLAEVKQLTKSRAPLPPYADPEPLKELQCETLIKLGWRPGGMDLLRQSLPAMLDL